MVRSAIAAHKTHFCSLTRSLRVNRGNTACIDSLCVLAEGLNVVMLRTYITSKAKVNSALEEISKAQKGIDVCFYFSFNLGARWEWLRPSLGHFTPGQEIRCPLYTSLGGLQGGFGRMRTISPLPGFCLFSCTRYFISTCFFVSTVLHFAICLYSPRIIQISCPRRDSNPQTLAVDHSATRIGRGERKRKFRSPNSLAGGESLYRLSYRDPQEFIIKMAM